MVLGPKKRVQLATKDGKTFEGLLMSRKPEFVLDLVSFLEEDKSHELKGRVHVLRENVAFYQVLS